MKRLSSHFCQLLLSAAFSLWSVTANAEHYTVPLLVPAGTSGDAQGVLRILNGTAEPGTVEIYAIDDAGSRSGPATFTLNASAAAEFTATDLQSGNATLGLTGGIGTDVGDARLEIETEIEIVPLAYVRAADGTLSAMHDTVRGASAEASGQYRYEVPVFNPSTETAQVSRLRLINPGDTVAAVTIGGRDDSGAEASGGDVTLMLPAGGAKTLTAQQLEAGDTDVAGQLGAGTGKRRLTVSSDRPLEVVNIVASSAGYWNNLSTTAVTGSAPQDHEAFNERFVGESVVYETSSGSFTLNAMDGDRFTETTETDGFTETYMGSYGYAATGPDAGRLTLMYDDGDECERNLHFASPTSGWFASHCTGSDEADGTWSGGSWMVVEDEDGDGDGGVVETIYGVDAALPGVPTAGAFVPSLSSGGSLTITGDGTTIALSDEAFFELTDGTRYTCTAADGCTVLNGTVTAGTITGRAAGGGEVDRFPSFRTATGPGNPSYTLGTAIDTLMLPAATGGNGTLTYSLSPSVPGLTFNATARQLTGSPSTAGTYAMTFTVTDEDGDTDTLSFTITVNTDTTAAGSLGECYVSLMVSIGQSCTYPGTTDQFSVNERGRGSFLTFLAGIRIRITNQTINGRVYDLLASHQGDGVWRIDRIAGSTEAPETPPMTGGGGMDSEDTSPSFAADAGPGNQTYTVGTAIDTLTLPEASGGDGAPAYSLTPDVPGLTFNATTRQVTGIPTTAASYNMTYTVTDEDGDTDTLSFTIAVEDAVETVSEGFDLTYPYSHQPQSMVYANNRIFVLHVIFNTNPTSVYAYSATGEREQAADFDFDLASGESAQGIAYANDRFYVFIRSGQGNKVIVFSATGEREPTADFDLAPETVFVDRIVAAEGRLFLFGGSESSGQFAHAYSVTGQRLREFDITVELYDVGPQPPGSLIRPWVQDVAITYVNRRFYMLEHYPSEADQRARGLTHSAVVGAYTLSGEREEIVPAPACSYGNLYPAMYCSGLVYFDGQFHVAGASSHTPHRTSGAWLLPISAPNIPSTLQGGVIRRDYSPIVNAQYARLNAFAEFPRGITYANSRLYVLDIDISGKVAYAYSAATGEREESADFNLSHRNDDFLHGPEGFTHFNGRFYALDSQSDTVHAFSATEEREAAADFDLSVSFFPKGIAHANGRLYVADNFDGKVYAYSATGEREAAADFDLDADNGDPGRIAFGNGRFYVIDGDDGKVYAYSATGERESAADFDLDADNGDPTGIAYVNGRFLVTDFANNWVYVYVAPTG